MGETVTAGQMQGPRGLASPSTVTVKVRKHVFWEITHNDSKDNKAVSWMFKIYLPREDHSCAWRENSEMQLDFKKTYTDSKKTFWLLQYSH